MIFSSPGKAFPVAEAAEALRYLVETVGCLNEPWSAFFVSLFRLPLELG